MRAHDPEFPQKMRGQNAEKKKRTGYPDKCEDKIERFSEERLVKGPDRMKIDKHTEAQSEEEADNLDHWPDCSQSPCSCQP
jgi:hypothetical protein